MEKIAKSGNFNIKIVSHDEPIKIKYDVQTEDIRAAFTVRTYFIHNDEKYYIDDMVNIQKVNWRSNDGDFLKEFDYYTLSGARGIAIKFFIDDTVKVYNLTYIV
jgi:hypothetical protein